jgi:hypothetical protein
MRAIKPTGKNLQAVAYLGMTLEALLSTISCSRVQRHMEKVVLSVGINNRERSPTSPTFRALFKALDIVFPEARFYFLEININQECGSKQKAAVDLINYRMRQARFRIIPKLPTEEFITTRDRIHWTNQTADAIVQRIMNHI